MRELTCQGTILRSGTLMFGEGARGLEITVMKISGFLIAGFYAGVHLSVWEVIVGIKKLMMPLLPIEKSSEVEVLTPQPRQLTDDHAACNSFSATCANSTNPAPNYELELYTPFELLNCRYLSAQATDVGVNKATDKLILWPIHAGNSRLGLNGTEKRHSKLSPVNSKAENVIQNLPAV